MNKSLPDIHQEKYLEFWKRMMAVGIYLYQVWSAAAILHVKIVPETNGEEDLPDLA